MDEDPYEWRIFDAVLGYELRQVDEAHWILRDNKGNEWALNAEEFDQLRSTGENPKCIP